MTDQNEARLVKRAKQGDMHAFEELIIQHEKIVYNVALRMMNHSEDAKDISQEVFLKAYRNIGNFDERSQFSTWIYRITANTCIDEMRKRKGRQSFSLEEELESEEGSMQRQVADAGESPEESMLREEQKSEILQALESLSPEHKVAVILRDIKGLSYEEIAEILELTLGTVKSRISRGRNQLKQEILKLREQDAHFAYNSTKSMLEELEKHMDSNAKQVLKNMEFVDKLREASNITSKISEVEAMSDSKQKDTESLTGDKKRLSELKQELNDLTTSYVSHKYTKEGASRTNIIDQWLEQTLLFEKAKAELLIVQNARQELNDRYVFFAPVGTTIKQKERSINYTERSYLTVLQSYNEALLRKKNLEMTSATLKVLNEPTYPIASNSTNRKQIVIAACIGSFLIIIALLLLIEILDRTLRDANRTKRVTGFKVIGAVPSPSSSRYGGLAKTNVQLSI